MSNKKKNQSRKDEGPVQSKDVKPKKKQKKLIKAQNNNNKKIGGPQQRRSAKSVESATPPSSTTTTSNAMMSSKPLSSLLSAAAAAPPPPPLQQQQQQQPPREVWSKSKKKRMRMIKGKIQAAQLVKANDDVGREQEPPPPRPLDSPEQVASANEPPPSNDGDDDDDHDEDDHPDNDTSSRRRPPETVEEPPAPVRPKPEKAAPSKLLQSFQARLTGSRFRMLNEELYTTPSAESFARFQAQPELYQQYHEGFRHQVAGWPVNPVDLLVKRLLSDYYTTNGAQHSNNSTTRDQQPVVVADFGCGDAALAQQLLKVHGPDGHQPWFQVHSFDLVAHHPLVTACDMAAVPLPEASVEVVVFCLSLMGTNLADFIREAHRVLVPDTGRVYVAEVRSRFEQPPNKKNKNKEKKAGAGESTSTSSAEKDGWKEFVAVWHKLGFRAVQVDRSHPMFVLMELRKKNGSVAPDPQVQYTAQPCIYKRR